MVWVGVLFGHFFAGVFFAVVVALASRRLRYAFGWMTYPRPGSLERL